MSLEQLQSKLDDLTSKVKEHEDLRQLNDLINTYHWVADHYRWDEWSELLTEDMVFEYIAKESHVFRGIREMTDAWKSILESCYESSQHVIVNRFFEIGPDGKTATGHANGLYYMTFDLSKPHENYMAGGRYEWKFVKTDGDWKIQHTRLQLTWEYGKDLQHPMVGEVNAASGV